MHNAAVVLKLVVARLYTLSDEEFSPLNGADLAPPLATVQLSRQV